MEEGGGFCNNVVYSSDEAHQQRSRIINEYKTQLRVLEKDLKRKKLSQGQREALQEQVSTLEKVHGENLAAFDAQHNTANTRKIASKPTPEVIASHSPPSDSDLEDRSWNSLSNKELEEECARRGLPKKGNKEELVSRLTIYTLERRAKKGGGGGNSGRPQEADGTGAKKKFEPLVELSAYRADKADKDQYKTKRKKLWKRRGPPPECQRDGSESENSDDDANGDDQSQEGTKKVDNTPAVNDEVDDARAKQLKREAIIAGVLGNILRKHTKGITIDSIPDLLQQNKVKNFAPQLLGYDSLEEWISKQPKHLLHFDKTHNLIFPPRVGQMPSSCSEEDEDSGVESNSSEDQI